MSLVVAGVVASTAAWSASNDAVLANARSAQDYARQLAALPHAERQRQLESELAYLQQLQADAEDALYSLAVFMSGGPGRKPTESVAEFKLDVDADGAQQMFEAFSDGLYYEQEMATNPGAQANDAPRLTFGSAYYPDEDAQEALRRRISSHIDYTVQALYHDGHAIAAADAGLKVVEKVDVVARLTLPVAASAFQVRPQDTHASHDGQRVDVLGFDGN